MQERPVSVPGFFFVTPRGHDHAIYVPLAGMTRTNPAAGGNEPAQIRFRPSSVGSPTLVLEETNDELTALMAKASTSDRSQSER